MVARRPTIADVALRAGVSKGLVSFVFNDRPGVAPQTRERIVVAARELGWRPSATARSLSTRRSLALGLVLRRPTQVLVADPFFPAFIAGIETVLNRTGQVLVLSMVPDEEAELRTYRTLVTDRRVDGVFLTDLRCRDPRLALLAELELPAVTIGRPLGARPFPAVILDDDQGVRRSVEHLVGLGHRRLAYVAGDPEMLHGLRRRASFVAAMRGAGLAHDQVIDTDFSPAQAGVATARLVEQATPPTAIIYASDPMAVAGMALLQSRGRLIPQQVSVTGFDGSDLASHLHPPLTTVAADPVTWGSTAAEVLLRLIADGEADDVELPAARLMIAGSTGPPPPD